MGPESFRGGADVASRFGILYTTGENPGGSGEVAKLYFRHGTMSSGKTLVLLAVAHAYEQQGKRILLACSVCYQRQLQGKGTVGRFIGG